MWIRSTCTMGYDGSLKQGDLHVSSSHAVRVRVSILASLWFPTAIVHSNLTRWFWLDSHEDHWRLAFCVGSISFGGTTFHRTPLLSLTFFVTPKSRRLAHGCSRRLLGRFRLVDFGVDVEVTLDCGITEEAGDSIGVPWSKSAFSHWTPPESISHYQGDCPARLS